MFITNAYAQTAGTPGIAGMLEGSWPILLMFVVLYFFMIRPQQKRMKEQRQMLEAISVGDEVVTTGGILGIISAVNGNILTLQVAMGVEVMLQKGAVSSLLPKGTVDLSNKCCAKDDMPPSSPSCCG